MITIERNFNFRAADFFAYLDQQLITAIKKARGNGLPVILGKGTTYHQGDMTAQIIQYQRGKIYEAHFKGALLDVTLCYQTQDLAHGVAVTFSEKDNDYDAHAHTALGNYLYRLRLKYSARRELKKMGAHVYAYLAQ